MFLQVGRAIIPHMGVRKAFDMTKRIMRKNRTRSSWSPRPRLVGRMHRRGHSPRVCNSIYV